MSQKVKEIEVWVYPHFTDDYWFSCHREQSDHVKANVKKMIKCTLLVPVEGKKVTISESEFDEMSRDILSDPEYRGAMISSNHTSALVKWKRKLFSGNGG